MAGAFRHLMVNVVDFEDSKRFYDRILGFLGYTLAHGSDTYAMWNPDRGGCSFGIRLVDPSMVDDPYVRGGAGWDHLAFNADSREQVDALYDLLKDLEAVVLDQPARVPSIARPTTLSTSRIPTG